MKKWPQRPNLAPDDYMIKPFSPRCCAAGSKVCCCASGLFVMSTGTFLAMNRKPQSQACDVLINSQPKYLVMPCASRANAHHAANASRTPRRCIGGDRLVAPFPGPPSCALPARHLCPKRRMKPPR